ncbi:MAG: hypothetical protein R3F61_37145 [Myxococcota bacterium]
MSLAHATDVRFCFDIATDFEDLGGDYWTTNADRYARGVAYEVENPPGTLIDTGFLGSTGCAETTLQAAADWRVRVKSEALWNGVELKSWSGTCHPTAVPDVSPWFQRAPSNPVVDEVVGPSGPWRHLALATWAIYRNKHGLGTGVARDCCQETNPNYQADGTCSTGVTDYSVVSGPVYLYENPASSSGDWIPACNPGMFPSGFRALNMGNTASKTLIAHEFGHLVTSLRMGWSDEPWQLTAPLEECMGDYTKSNTSLADAPADYPGFANGRGEFTKEYLASAIREGYADFYSMWLWNSRQTEACVFDMWTLHDFDLDCDVDDFFGTADPRNGRIDCSSAGWETEQADVSDPTTAYSDGKNWLSDLENAPDFRAAHPSSYLCGIAGSITQTCSDDSSYDYDRSTMIDLAQFFWMLNVVNEGGLAPKTVTDLYIDTCPRGWDTMNGPFWSDAHPYQRLLLSADEHSILTEVTDYEDFFKL